MSMNASKYLDLHVAHIQERDLEELQRQADDGIAKKLLPVFSYRWGYFVPIPAVFEKGVMDVFSEEFVQLLCRCAQEGIRLVRIDEMGDEHEELARYDT